MLIDFYQHILLPRIHIEPAATPPPLTLNSQRIANLFSRFACSFLLDYAVQVKGQVIVKRHRYFF
jgi:hypothetical protein